VRVQTDFALKGERALSISDGGGKNTKKVLISTVVLLVLSMLVFTPIQAKKPIAPYNGTIVIDLQDEGKQWTTNGSILQIKGSYWNGTEESSLGTNKFEDWESFTINLKTGNGTFHGKWLLTVGTRGTFSGSACGKISQGNLITGIFIGAHGTGEFEGAKKWGKLDGILETPTRAVLNFEGFIKYPKD